MAFPHASFAGDAKPQHALTACPAAPHARSARSSDCCRANVRHLRGAVDAPPGTAAETVVDRLAAQAVLAFRERHGLVLSGRC